MDRISVSRNTAPQRSGAQTRFTWFPMHRRPGSGVRWEARSEARQQAKTLPKRKPGRPAMGEAAPEKNQAKSAKNLRVPPKTRSISEKSASPAAPRPGPILSLTVPTRSKENLRLPRLAGSGSPVRSPRMVLRPAAGSLCSASAQEKSNATLTPLLPPPDSGFLMPARGHQQHNQNSSSKPLWLFATWIIFSVGASRSRLHPTPLTG